MVVNLYFLAYLSALSEMHASGIRDRGSGTYMQGMGVFLIEELSRLWHEVEDH
jgi:hypothetical protein